MATLDHSLYYKYDLPAPTRPNKILRQNEHFISVFDVLFNVLLEGSETPCKVLWYKFLAYAIRCIVANLIQKYK